MMDLDVRESIWRWLEREHAGDDNALMLDELGTLNGFTRVDITVANGEIAGFELESERDTLERLPMQRDLYNLVFDKISLRSRREPPRRSTCDRSRRWGACIAYSVFESYVEVI